VCGDGLIARRPLPESPEANSNNPERIRCARSSSPRLRVSAPVDGWADMVSTCADCKRAIHQQELPSPSDDFGMAILWADLQGEWLCPVTGEEHRRAVPDWP